MRSVWREVIKHNKQRHTRWEMSEAWKHFRPPLNEQFNDEEAALALFFWYTYFFAHLEPTVRTIPEWDSRLTTCRDQAKQLRASAKVLRELRLMPGGAQNWFQVGDISIQFQNIYANQIEDAAGFYDEISETIINRKTKEADWLTVERDFRNRTPRAYIRLLAPETRILFGIPHAHIAHILWIAHAHCMDAWESTPRLAALSPEPESGKTRLLETTALLVPNPVEAINVSVAYLFRKVGGEDGPPTILFDEIDTVFGPKARENEETRALLNAGHRRGAVAGRCVVKGKTVETEEIPAYCAVALAGLGWLPDTILSRSIIIRMRRRHAGEHEQYRHRVNSREGHQLRDTLAAWAAGMTDALASARPDMPNGVEDRAADCWEPLFAIADAIGGEWPSKARAAAVSLVSDAKEIEPSLGIKLLADLQTVFGNAGLMPTAAILTALHGLSESPWGDLKGKPLNDRGLALRLRQYGIKSKQVRTGDITLKGYDRTDFFDVWRRYLPQPSDKTKTNETNETG